MPRSPHFLALLLLVLLLTGCQSGVPVGEDTLCTGEAAHTLQYSTNPPVDSEIVAEHGLMVVKMSTTSTSRSSMYVEALDNLCIEPTDSSREGEVVTLRMRAQGEVVASGDGEAMTLFYMTNEKKLQRRAGYLSDNNPGNYDEVVEAQVELGRWFPIVAQADISTLAGSASAVLTYGVDGVVAAGGSPVSIRGVRSQSETDY